ncbi:MAG TPA: hypothetical protein VFL57_01910 [Bryobacteraceae bacterium]|nr:hypothetical protein [Bryobacteraceae bacterium]
MLFPVVDRDVVEPEDYGAWEELIYRTVRHYKDRGSNVGYWEVGNEVDIGEDGGCPYRFKPDSYVRYYEHTVKAVLGEDPQARVGGPALASVRSPILAALLEACDSRKIPMHFISWHMYNSEPLNIVYVQGQEDKADIDETSARGFNYATILHVQNFADRMRTRKTPTALMSIAFQAALVVQLANLSLKSGRRMK